jgi:hypothetical protein
MKNDERSTKRAFLVGAIVTVGAFCFWPNGLTGLFALGTVIGWIAYDSHDFLRAVWRTVLLAGVLIGAVLTGLAIYSRPLPNPIQCGTVGIVLVVLSIIGFVRSILAARKDWTME